MIDTLGFKHPNCIIRGGNTYTFLNIFGLTFETNGPLSLSGVAASRKTGNYSIVVMVVNSLHAIFTAVKGFVLVNATF